MLVKNQILGVGVTNEKSSSILEYVLKNIEKNTKKYYITTPNPEIIVYATKNQHFRNILNEADLALCDGVGLTFAGKILKKPFVERVTGVDFMEELCKRVAKKPITVGFLGGRGRVAQLTAERLKQRFPDLSVVLAEAGNPDQKTMELVKQKAEHYAASHHDTIGSGKKEIDILFVGFGFPKQEEWIYTYLPTLPVRYAMVVGGAFDYLSGSVPRAPKALRAVGLEWLFRLMVQPWRLKRQLALIEFILLVLKEKIKN